MIKFKIKKINNYNYILEDKDGREYSISIQFYDIKQLPQKGEYIYFSEKLLDKATNEGVTHFSFGGLSEIYGKDINNRKYK